MAFGSSYWEVGKKNRGFKKSDNVIFLLVGILRFMVR